MRRSWRAVFCGGSNQASIQSLTAHRNHLATSFRCYRHNNLAIPAATATYPAAGRHLPGQRLGGGAAMLPRTLPPPRRPARAAPGAPAGRLPFLQTFRTEVSTPVNGSTAAPRVCIPPAKRPAGAAPGVSCGLQRSSLLGSKLASVLSRTSSLCPTLHAAAGWHRRHPHRRRQQASCRQPVGVSCSGGAAATACHPCPQHPPCSVGGFLGLFTATAAAACKGGRVSRARHK